MENLIKKLLGRNEKNEVVINSSERAGSDTNYPSEVYEIHHEFSIAADKLLLEAKSIIDEASTKDCAKVSRLEALGFKQARQVTELKPLIEKAKLSKEQVEFLNYYSINYPNNKFITEGQVKAICYKWNLVCAEVSRFKGFVPEKNLKQIENFKLKQQDELDEIVVFNGVTGEIANLDWSKVKDEQQVMYLVNDYLTRNDFTYICSYSDYPKFTRIANKSRYSEPEFIIQLKQQHSFQICAPVKDMDLTGLTIEGGYKAIKKFVPDPVVLQPVKGGYLILTAWGDEASDENVVNQKFN